MTWQMIAATVIGGVVAATVTLLVVACLTLASRADDDMERLEIERTDDR